jgi:hypothetical protein
MTAAYEIFELTMFVVFVEFLENVATLFLII